MLVKIFQADLFIDFYRKGDETGHFPSMFLQKASKRDIYEVQRASLHGQKPPPRRYVRDHDCENKSVRRYSSGAN